jgi:hypothetical protein
MVQNNTCSCFSSLSDDAGGKVILDVEEADPEVIRKYAGGQWSMGGRAGILITCGAYVVSDKRGVGRGGHSIFFSLFAIDGSITFSLLIDFDKSTFLGIFMFASSINRCFRQVTKNRSLSKIANR